MTDRGDIGRQRPARSPWQLGAGDAETAETVLAEARKALFVMVGFLALLWIVQIANAADHYQLTADYGIIPRDVSRLPDIFVAPFLHFSWAHIEGNSGPLFIFGFLAAYRGVRKFLGLTLFVAITSGLAAWIFMNPHGPGGTVTIGAGASGVVFGYFGYIIVRGFFDRRPIDVMVGLVMALCFAYQFSVLLPAVGIGWQAHIGGVVGGVAAGWLFRDRGPRKPAVPPAARPGTTSATQPGTIPATRPGGPQAGGARSALHKARDTMGL
jgi:membrane associated rhomboid family serine protease